MADDELSESNISTDSVILFDGDEEPERPEKLNQHRKPVVGDRISYFDAASSTWINAIITHDLSRRYRHYFNIKCEDGRPDGLYLKPNTRWTLRTALNDDSPEENRFVQNSTSSLRPTPDSSLPQRSPQTSDRENCYDAPNIAFNATLCDSPNSLQWDYTHDHTPSYAVSLDRTGIFDNILPLAQDAIRLVPEPDNLLLVQDLSNRLPLSSTPLVHNARISQQRRLLPLELESRRRFSIPTFLRRFNIFRDRS